MVDCVQFQEQLLASKLIFIAGMAEAKSKGRGEECISQNLRILRAPNGKRVMLFFANSQRHELKRYVSIPRKFDKFPRPLNLPDINPSQLCRECEAPEKGWETSGFGIVSEFRGLNADAKFIDPVP